MVLQKTLANAIILGTAAALWVFGEMYHDRDSMYLETILSQLHCTLGCCQAF